MINTRSILNGLSSISLAEMDNVKLLNRTDTKFIFSIEKLDALLLALQADYRILEIEGKRQSQYMTVYLDTPDLTFYFAHHNGKKNRVKIRLREYVDSGLCFLEVKQKSNKGRTVKQRMQIPAIPENLSEQNKEYINRITGQELDLSPAITNSFYRITLVHKTKPERFTIDTRLTFSLNGQTEDFPDLVITELKQSVASRNTDSFQILRELGIRPTSISKYCLGTVALRPEIKNNNFKQNRILIDRL